MSVFESTNKRLQKVSARIAGFPVEQMRLMRMTYHIQKNMRDLTNAALKPYDLVDASYIVLAVLYGCDDETASASALGQACHEKPANLTRVCNDLETRGLIQRGTRAGDRRAVMISLTDAGRALIVKVLPLVCNNTVQIYEGITSADLGALEALFARQLSNLEAMI
jgi:MarR family transcriptional repressor of emrRAB